MRSELETEQNCNILTPTLMAITAFLSRSPGLFNRGPGAQHLWDMFLIPVSSLQLIWTSTAQSGVLRAPSAWCWFSLPHLITNWLNFLCTELYNNLTSTLLPASVTNRTHSTRPRSWFYPDIPRPDAPVIYTGSFPILTAWPGSICNSCFLLFPALIKIIIIIIIIKCIICILFENSDIVYFTMPAQSFLYGVC